MNIKTLQGSQLTSDHLQQLTQSAIREFQMEPPFSDERDHTTYFLLMDKSQILASANLTTTHPVTFNNQTFSLLNIGWTIANQKRKGYGKQIITEIKKYLTQRQKTGLGFCMPKNLPFYQNSGLQVTNTATKQFIYRQNEKDISVTGPQYVIYQEGSDNFMTKVLANPQEKIFVPHDRMW